MTTVPLLIQVFRSPETVLRLKLCDWDLLIRQARRANVLATLDLLLSERGLIESVPAWPRRHFEWIRRIAEQHQRAVQWEVTQIRKALHQLSRVTLLKGAAYVMAGLPAARGRLFSDVDILVSKGELQKAEGALMLHGWACTHPGEYDQQYYRKWMHELPPMQHVRRGSTLDVHHAILPPTARLRPDPAKLHREARRLPGQPGLFVLAPCDMVLHSMVHLFHDGEFDNAFRDLVDIDALIRHFSTEEPGFWPGLVARAEELQLSRPLFYALRHVVRLLETPVPTGVRELASRGGPPLPLLRIMDALFNRALLPQHASCEDWWMAGARRALYIRSHWLKMPPMLLTTHLFYKAFLSPKSALQD